MGSEQLNPTGPGPEPELHLLISDKQFEEPLYRSLFRELDEFFFPKKLPPLKLESKPAPVKGLWAECRRTSCGTCATPSRMPCCPRRERVGAAASARVKVAV